MTSQNIMVCKFHDLMGLKSAHNRITRRGLKMCSILKTESTIYNLQPTTRDRETKQLTSAGIKRNQR